MTRSQLLTAIAFVMVLGSAALAQSSGKVRTFNGTHTCIACDLHKTVGARAQCETFGHDFGIKLNNGTYIHFIANDHSVDLVKDHGRIDFPMTVTGIYDASAHTIDVQKYSIDGIETTWSEKDQKMEMVPNHKQLVDSKESKDEKLTSK